VNSKSKLRLKEADIHKVADTLIAKGENPTAIRIYEHLGHGSLTTITKYHRSWRVKREQVELKINEPTSIDSTSLIELMTYFKNEAEEGVGQESLIESYRLIIDQKNEIINKLHLLLGSNQDREDQSLKYFEKEINELTEELVRSEENNIALRSELDDLNTLYNGMFESSQLKYDQLLRQIPYIKKRLISCKKELKEFKIQAGTDNKKVVVTVTKVPRNDYLA